MESQKASRILGDVPSMQCSPLDLRMLRSTGHSTEKSPQVILAGKRTRGFLAAVARTHRRKFKEGAMNSG